MKNPLILLAFLAITTIAHGQKDSIRTLYGTVVDSLDNRPISFVSIYKKNDKKGTISSFDGHFTLQNVHFDDTLICFYIGYEKKQLIARDVFGSGVLQLTKESQLINAVTVLANDAFLYKIISNCKKTQKSKSQIAKTFFELESFHEGKQLELFQAYYNGTFSGYDVSKLELKNGRIALSPIDKRYFVSTETSKAMYLHQLMSHNDYFPTSPFELNIRKLRKEYQLSLNSKYKDAFSNIIYVIGFSHRYANKNYFEGTVWIDSTSNRVTKVKLKLNNTTIHPFTPIWSTHDLKKVDLEISKTYNENNQLQSTDFNYKLDYQSDDSTLLHTSTRAVLYAYNYDDQFLLPYFDFSKSQLNDYKKLNAIPYNKDFWKCTDEFKVSTSQAQKDVFRTDSTTINEQTFFSSYFGSKKGFFERPYIAWSKNRIQFRDESEDSTKYDLTIGVIPSERYYLKAQIFLDINELCDSIQIITKTIFDPYQSFYHFPTTKTSMAFINIYFDLIETQRLELNRQLSLCKGDIDHMKKVYERIKISTEQLSEQYFKEVQRGTNTLELIKWNNHIIQVLAIDNISLFHVLDEE